MAILYFTIHHDGLNIGTIWAIRMDESEDGTKFFYNQKRDMVCAIDKDVSVTLKAHNAIETHPAVQLSEEVPHPVVMVTPALQIEAPLAEQPEKSRWWEFWKP